MSPLQVPQRGPYGDRCLFPEPSFTYSSGSPGKVASPPGFLHRALIATDAPFPKPTFICPSRVRSKRNPLQVPERGHYGESCPFTESSFMSLGFPHISSPDKKKSRPSLEVPWKGK